MAKRPMTAAQYERSAADRRSDAAGAAKAKTSVARWEGSAADRKADAKAMKGKGK